MRKWGGWIHPSGWFSGFLFVNPPIYKPLSSAIFGRGTALLRGLRNFSPFTDWDDAPSRWRNTPIHMGLSPFPSSHQDFCIFSGNPTIAGGQPTARYVSHSWRGHFFTHTVDGKNPAPFMMPEMLFLYQ